MARRHRRFPAKPIILGALQLAAASSVAGPTVTPPQTVHVIQAPAAASHQQDRARSTSHVYAPRPQTLYVPRVTFDAATIGGGLSFTHTCTGSNRYLTVGVALAGSSVSVTGVTYAGQALTLVRRAVGANSSELWGLAAPASGSNTVAITLSGATGTAQGAVSFVNAAQAGQPGQSGAASGASAPITSSPVAGPYGGMLVDIVADGGITIQTGIQAWNDGGGDGQAYLQADGSFQSIVWSTGVNWADAVGVVLPVGFQAQQPRQTVIQPTAASAKVQTRRHGSVVAPRPAALAVTQAAPTVTPTRTVWVVEAQQRRQGHASHVTAPRPSALTNHAILQAGSPKTVTVIDSDALAWRRAQHASRIIEPRPAALTNHAILSAGLPQTVTVKPARTPSRARRSAEIVAPRPSGLTFTPAAPATPPRTAWVIEAQTPRQHQRGSVLAPRPSGLVFTPAAPSVPPRTVWVIEAHPPRPARHSAVLSPRPQGLIFTPAAVTTPPRTVTIITARTAAGRVVRARVVAPRPVFAPVTAPRPVVVDQAPLAKRKPRLGRITSLKGPPPVAAPTTPPKPVIVQAKPRRRVARGGVLHALRQRFATGAGPAPTIITTPATGYVSVGDTAQPSVGDTGLISVDSSGAQLVGDTGIPRQGYAPSDICVLGYSNQVLGGVLVGDVETLIGRQFHGLRQNQAYTTTGVGTAITEFDAGRTTSYRAIQFDTAPGGWAAVATGVADTQLTTFCNNVTAANRWTTQNPFLVCLHHEATLSPFGSAGFSAADYKAMWAHCVPLMLATGAPIAFAYVGWDRMFVGANGIGPPTAGQGIDDLDPGSSLYTYIGSDVYNAIDSPGVLRYGLSAATLLDPIRAAATARGKDWIIGEMGCEDGATTTDHTNKAFWLDGLRTYIDGCGTTSPGVCRAMLTTIKASAENYNVDSSAESLAAWQRLGFDSYYA